MAVTARNRASVTGLAARYGDRAPALALDVTDSESVTAAVQACEAAFGRIDVLGTMPPGRPRRGRGHRGPCPVRRRRAPKAVSA
ncbi:SDR family oxidoreductase [Streptomyces sp. NRRL S-813]|uniref:SDR family oxidoreductase n=1 Tax=Streptomyces sp. NRRL S-813 TaxID=1463919 RepID=UPI000ADBF3BB|nr:SDR family oxidoreductase [Streptomyces sp. NRRL S-813]